MSTKHPNSKYNPVYMKHLDDYLATCVDEERDYVTFDSEKGKGYKKDIKVNIPTIEGFASYLYNYYKNDTTIPKDELPAFSSGLLQEWERTHPEVAVALTYIRDKLSSRLIQGGLGGQYEKGMASMILRSQARHYEPVNKQEINAIVENSVKLSDDNIDKVLDILNSERE